MECVSNDRKSMIVEGSCYMQR